MALKKILDTLDGLSDDVKKEYKEKDGKFVLDIEGDDSDTQISHLKQNKDIAEEHRVKAEKKVEELQNMLDDMRRGNIPKSDVEALENSWKDKLNQATELSKSEKAKLQKQLDKVLRQDTAHRIAAELSTVPDLLVPTIVSRLAVEEGEDGEVKVRVKDKAGKMSALTLEDLKTEIRGIEKYAPILIASKGSGGGAGGPKNQNPGGNELAKMSEADRVAWFKRDPEGFRNALNMS